MSSTLVPSIYGGVVQLARILDCHSRGRGFNPRRHRQAQVGVLTQKTPGDSVGPSNDRIICPTSLMERTCGYELQDEGPIPSLGAKTSQPKALRPIQQILRQVLSILVKNWLHARLVQLVERQTVNLYVAGSSPASGARALRSNVASAV